MLRNQLVDVLADGCLQGLLILGSHFLQDGHEGGIIYHLMNACFLRVEAYIGSEVYHHVGKDLDLPALSVLSVSLGAPYEHVGNTGVLDPVAGSLGQGLPCLGKDLSGAAVHHILRQDLSVQAVAECKLLVEFISSYLGQIVASRIEEHAHNQAFCAFYGQRLARTYLLVKLQETFLVILCRILTQCRQDLRLLSE